jgi:signal peptidase I
MRALAVLYNLLLVPGVGHIAIGRWRRGLPWLLLSHVWFLGLWFPAVALLLMFIPRVASAIEVARLERRWSPNLVQGSTVYGVGLLASVCLIVLQRTYVIEAWKIPSGSMIPTLEIGDHLFASKLAYRLGEPARGDLAVFVYPCEPDKDFVSRIVGLPGDTVEVRCDVLYLNGRAVPATSLKEACEHWDRREDDGPWVRESCTTYLEELDGRQHETVHSATRRERDKLRKLVAGERSYEELRGDGDFPDGERMPRCPSVSLPGHEARPPVGRLEKAAGGPPADACAPRQHYVVPDGHVFVMGDNRENSSDSRRWGPVPLDHLEGKVMSIWWSSRPDAQGGIAWDRIGPVE